MAPGSRWSKILLLGHTGFIGRAAHRRLELHAAPTPVVGLSSSQVDLTRWESVRALSPMLAPDVALVMGAAVLKDLDDPQAVFLKNCQMASNLARLLGEQPVGRVVYVSSCSIYDEARDDLAFTEDTPVEPTCPYGISKYASECLIRGVSANGSRFPLLVARPSTVYGPGDSRKLYLAAAFARSMLSSGSVTLWGDGRELRDFIYVEDVAELLARLTLGEDTGTFLLASGMTHGYREMVDLLGRISGIDCDIRSRPRTKRRVNRGFRNDKLLGVLGEFRFTPLHEGLAHTFEAVRSELAELAMPTYPLHARVG